MLKTHSVRVPLSVVLSLVGVHFPQFYNLNLDEWHLPFHWPFRSGSGVEIVTQEAPSPRQPLYSPGSPFMPPL